MNGAMNSVVATVDPGVFGKTVIGLFSAFASFAGLVSLYIWRHIHNTEVSENVETVVDWKVLDVYREFSRIFSTDGDPVSDGIDPKESEQVRELVAGRQRDRAEDILDNYVRARRQFAWVSLGSFGFALTFVVYSLQGLTLTPWPPDTWDTPLVAILGLMTWALYCGIRNFNEASRQERRLQRDANQCRSDISRSSADQEGTDDTKEQARE